MYTLTHAHSMHLLTNVTWFASSFFFVFFLLTTCSKNLNKMYSYFGVNLCLNISNCFISFPFVEHLLLLLLYLCYSNVECHHYLNDPNIVCACVFCFGFISSTSCSFLLSIWLILFAFHFIRHFIWPIFDLSIYVQVNLYGQNI